jgi:rare lipoprotein A
MSFRHLRRTLLALALVAPVTAAHPTVTTPPAVAASGSDAAFEGEFAGYNQLPAAPVPGDGAVDIATIEHSHPGDDDVDRELGSGSASYYAAKFHGRRTASGERFDNTAMTAAHRTLPFGSKVRVTNPANGKSVVVRINDRGPFTRGRAIDVSHAAARQLGLIARGHGTVEMALLD